MARRFLALKHIDVDVGACRDIPACCKRSTEHCSHRSHVACILRLRMIEGVRQKVNSADEVSKLTSSQGGARVRSKHPLVKGQVRFYNRGAERHCGKRRVYFPGVVRETHTTSVSLDHLSQNIQADFVRSSRIPRGTLKKCKLDRPLP